MADARQETEWERTAFLLSKIHNTAMTPMVSPDQCNPFKKQEPPQKVSLKEGRRIMEKGK